MQRFWRSCLCLLLACSSIRLAAEDGLDLTMPGEEPAPVAPAAGGNDLTKGGILFRLVPIKTPTEPLGPQLFWRSFEGSVGAQTAPVKLTIDGEPVYGPQQAIIPETKVPTTVYPTEGRKLLSNGVHTIVPGNIKITMTAGKLTCDHPAIKVVDDTVNILCAPVRLDAVDSHGIPLPLTIKLSCDKEPLLRENASFRPLIAYLPVGLSYTSSLGRFTLSPEGKVLAEPAALSANVKLSNEGLRLNVEPPKRTEKAESNSRIFEVPIGEKSGRLSYYIEPFVKPGERGMVAFSRKQFDALAKSANDPSAFSYSLAQHTSKPSQARSSFTPDLLKPPADAVAKIAAALQIDAADVECFCFPIEKVPLGVAPFSLFHPAFNRIGAFFIVADPAAPLQIMPHRLRTVFTDQEQAPINIIAMPGFAGGEVKLLCQAVGAGNPLELGKFTIPAATERPDGRLVYVQTRDVPAGEYLLWAQGAGGSSSRINFKIVPWARRNSFLIHYMSGCGGEPANNDVAMRNQAKAGLEMFCSGGFGSMHEFAVPGIGQEAASWLKAESPKLPAELAYTRTSNDELLQDLLRNRVRQLDFYPRAGNFYLEGLSYHHSYKPSVDRVIKHLQVFAQQTADYPSYWGMNHSWFPNLYGYSEGGVDTDIHKRDRNAALHANLLAAGYKELTPEERKFYEANKFSTDANAKAKAQQLMRQGIIWWKASYDFGFGKHNQLYNDRIRDVIPGAQCVIYENAGHDSGKPTRSLFNAMDAVTYESYSDYPEWPMSAAFTTDWGRGQFPEKPLWLTTDPNSSSEGNIKSLIHAFMRGAAAVGTLMPTDMPAAEVERRGKGQNFAAQYGAVAMYGIPDRRVGILATDADQVFSSGQYLCHAMYYHLTRLGYPAVILNESDFKKSGAAEDTKILILPKVRQPFESETLAAIDAFVKRGGKVIRTSDSLTTVPDAFTAGLELRTIWDVGGFVSHTQMWQEFDKCRGPLLESLKAADVPPAASTDPDRGLAIVTNASNVRYVAVFPEEKGQPSYVFKPEPHIPVSIEGTGLIVRDLRAQQDVKTTEKDGRTEFSVDMIVEPVTLLAVYKKAPDTVSVLVRGTPKLGGTLAFTSSVSAGGQVFEHAPVRYEIIDAAGKVRDTLNRATGEEVSVPIPALDTPGAWKIVAQETLTGVTAVAEIKLDATPPAKPVASVVGDVHAVNEAQIRSFFKRPESKLIIVESGQEHLLPLAQKLSTDLTAAGVKNRIWQVRPEDFDTIPVRWYPWVGDDVPNLKAVDDVKLIGFRQSMKAWIDPPTRQHLPERGGYEEIAPYYMLNSDCILFSGGKMCESLRIVSAWMPTPNVPGKGQGRLLMVFSPFNADHHALAVLGNDIDGITKAAAAAPSFAAAQPAAPAAAAEELKAIAAKIETRAVPMPLQNYTPIRRALRLLATPEGKAVVALESKNNSLVFIDAAGKVTGMAQTELKHLRHASIDAQGRFWDFTSKHLGGEWYNQAQTMRCINSDGTLALDFPAYSGSIYYDYAPTDWEGGLHATPDGTRALVMQHGGWVFGAPGSEQWIRYDDVPNVGQRDAIRHPRMPVGSVFSADNKYLLLTMDTRPPGWGGMNWPGEHPCCSETALFETATGKRVWRLRDEQIRKATYAVHTGFGAVSNDGNVTAIADYAGSIYLIDKTGQIVSKKTVNKSFPERYSTGPENGVGVWMNDSGSLAMFGYKGQVFLTSGKDFVQAPVSMLIGGCVAGDGSMAVVAQDSGEVIAFDPGGKQKWSVNVGGVGPLISPVGANQVLVVNSDGELILLGSDGKETRPRVGVYKLAEGEKKELKPSAQYKSMPQPQQYVEPATLAIAKKDFGAQLAAEWKPAGEGKKLLGKTFYPVTAPITLSGKDDKEYFLHMVYRLAEKTVATVKVTGKEPEVFTLDLPTLEYRVVDIPLHGANASATVTFAGGAEVAECGLYSFNWPGVNVAFVQPAKEPGADLDANPGDDTGDEALLMLKGAGGVKGGIKDANIFCPNSDVDKVAGQNIKPLVDALRMVDGKRFGGGKLPPWMAKMFVGSWFEIDMTKDLPLMAVATYERSTKQSGVNSNIAIYSKLDPKGPETVRNGCVDNDQFWRLFPITGDKTRILGVHIIAGAQEGLSEIEAYQKVTP